MQCIVAPRINQLVYQMGCKKENRILLKWRNWVVIRFLPSGFFESSRKKTLLLVYWLDFRRPGFGKL